MISLPIYSVHFKGIVIVLDLSSPIQGIKACSHAVHAHHTIANLWQTEFLAINLSQERK